MEPIMLPFADLLPFFLEKLKLPSASFQDLRDDETNDYICHVSLDCLNFTGVSELMVFSATSVENLKDAQHKASLKLIHHLMAAYKFTVIDVNYPLMVEPASAHESSHSHVSANNMPSIHSTFEHVDSKTFPVHLDTTSSSKNIIPKPLSESNHFNICSILETDLGILPGDVEMVDRNTNFSQDSSDDFQVSPTHEIEELPPESVFIDENIDMFGFVSPNHSPNISSCLYEKLQEKVELYELEIQEIRAVLSQTQLELFVSRENESTLSRHVVAFAKSLKNIVPSELFCCCKASTSCCADGRG